MKYWKLLGHESEPKGVPYNYFELENVFDEKTLDHLLKEFPDVSETISVMGGEED